MLQLIVRSSSPSALTKKGMKGDDYLNHFVLPNYHFHLTIAYAILCHCGVEIGKLDFLGAIPIIIELIPRESLFTLNAGC
jgi:hypothetical protein